jgi:hypothetical protein
LSREPFEIRSFGFHPLPEIANFWRFAMRYKEGGFVPVFSFTCPISATAATIN